MKNVYQIITDKIIEQLNKGIIPWRKPWSNVSSEMSCYNIVSGREYSFLNCMLLEKAGGYMTFKQAKEKGYHIKKGAVANVVTFWMTQQYTEEVQHEDGTTGELKLSRPVLKYYQVFHQDDIEGLEVKTTAEDVRPTLSQDEKAEGIITEYVQRSCIKFTAKESCSAYYSPVTDEVVVPSIEQYTNVGEYYSTIFHELTHSTGAKSRLDRGLLKDAGFGSENYSKEELVAEIGSAMLTSLCDFDVKESFQNSVAYISGWMQRLKEDNRLIVSAASRAEKAVKYILNEE